MHFRDSSDNFFVAIAVAAGCSCGGVSGSVSGLRLSYVCFGGAILTTCPGGGGGGGGALGTFPPRLRLSKVLGACMCDDEFALSPLYTVFG